MATVSLYKTFVVKDEKAFNQLKKDIEEKSDKNRTIQKAPSLERGMEKLKHFTFR